MEPVDFASAVPDTKANVVLPGAKAAIEIYRDRYGIPHVRASNSHDAFFGQAFATAQDRLWQMDLDRLRAYGRSAEYLGPQAVDADIKMRRFQLGPSVEIDYEGLDPATRAMLDAYAAGVNAFIGVAPLPAEYRLVARSPEPWRPWDCLAVHKIRHTGQGVFEQKLWRARLVAELGPTRTSALVPGYRPGRQLILPPEGLFKGPGLDGLGPLARGLEVAGWVGELEGGSNNWALSGEKTESGSPLLGGDPHRQLDVPNIYYQSHIACPEFDAIGLTFAGVPGFPNFGHNEHVAWCLTHGMADEQDLYLERFHPDDSTLYESCGDWVRAASASEKINVNGGSAADLQVISTRHGPIIAGDPAQGHAIALRQTATCEPNTSFAAVRKMLGAKSADEIEEAMREWVSPVQNFVFGDVHGEIGYLLRGRLPVRHESNAWLPVPGWTEEHDWESFVPFEEMPRARNPETKYIVTANNKIVGEEFPYHIALDFAPGFRAQRLVERLASLEAATVSDMTEMLKDLVSIPGRVYSRLLRNAPVEGALALKARDALLAWDGAMEPGTAAPAIYRSFRRRLDHAIFGHLFGPLANAVRGSTGGSAAHGRRLSGYFVWMAEAGDERLLPPGADWPSLAAQALSEAAADLEDRLGPSVEAWRWGNVHFTQPKHQLSAALPDLADHLDPPSVPMPGDADTPLVSSCLGPDSSVVTNTSVARYVFDTSDWDNSAWVVPIGSSGHPGSPHYTDQLPIWAESRLVPMLFSWDRIEDEAETRQTLTPDAETTAR